MEQNSSVYRELQETWKLGLLSRSSSKDSLSVIEVRAMAIVVMIMTLYCHHQEWPGHWGAGGGSKEAPAISGLCQGWGSRAALKDIPIGIRTQMTLGGTRAPLTWHPHTEYFVQQLLIIGQRYIGALNAAACGLSVIVWREDL